MYEMHKQPENLTDIGSASEIDTGETIADVDADLLNAESLDSYSDEDISCDPADIPEGEFGLPGLPPSGTVTERPMPPRVPIYGVRIHSDNSVEHIEVPVSVAAREAQRLTAERQKILETYTPNRQGMDIERVDQFLREVGVVATDATIEVFDEQRAAVMGTLGRRDAGQHGTYIQSIDVAFTFRDHRLEELNGVPHSDMVRLHELVHSGGAFTTVFLDTGERRTVRDIYGGYVTRLYDGSMINRFIDEGVPQYLAGKYIAEKLDMPGGLARLPEASVRLANRSVGTLVVPSQYMIRMGKEKVGIIPAGFAGAAIGRLIDRDPALLPAFVHGMHDSEAHKEVIGRLNAISPGLYGDLRNNFNDYSKLGFARGAAYVCGILGIE